MHWSTAEVNGGDGWSVVPNVLITEREVAASSLPFIPLCSSAPWLCRWDFSIENLAQFLPSQGCMQPLLILQCLNSMLARWRCMSVHLFWADIIRGCLLQYSIWRMVSPFSTLPAVRTCRGCFLCDKLTGEYQYGFRVNGLIIDLLTWKTVADRLRAL